MHNSLVASETTTTFDHENVHVEITKKKRNAFNLLSFFVDGHDKWGNSPGGQAGRQAVI